MLRLIRLLAENPETILAILPYIPAFLVLIFTIYIANYIAKRYKGKERNFLVIGAVLKTLAYISSFVVSYIIVPGLTDFGGDYSIISYYYGAVNFIGATGDLVFLYGAFLLMKKYLMGSPVKETLSASEPNSFIQRN